MVIANKEIIKKRFNRNFQTYNCAAEVQKKVVHKFCEMLLQFGITDLNFVLEIGCGTGFLSRQFLKINKPNHVILNDLHKEMYDGLNGFDEELTSKCTYLPGDAETIKFPTGLDGVISTSTFQWFHHTKEFFNKVNNHLVKDGIFAFSTFGENNYKEIKQLLNIGLDYHSESELIDMLGNNFDIIAAKQWSEKMFFDSPEGVLKHIKYTGVNGLLNFSWSKSKLIKFQEDYTKYFSVGNKVSLSYHPIIVLAKKKAA